MLGGDVLLTSFLRAPPSFLNVSRSDIPGRYVFGSSDFRVLDVRVAGVLHRSYAGRQEDLVLGIISVLLIALLSEIVQTVLMRTRRPGPHAVSRAGLHAAYLLDEAAHFRNLWALCRRKPDRHSPTRKRVAVNSLVIVAIAVGLLAAEVVAVYLTQPFRVYTTKYQYNLKGVQPAGTALHTALGVDSLTSKKRCVTPSMMHSNQSREYSLNACIMRSFDTVLDHQDDEATYVDVSSWYHEAGSDHVVEFSNGEETGRHEVQARASIMQGQTGVSKGILFEVRDNEERDNAIYLQMYMIYTAMQWNCEQEWETRTCMDMKDRMDAGTPVRVNKSIVFWEKKEDETTEVVEGVKIRFNITLRQPFTAVQSALHVFTTSAVIEEVEGHGMYVNMDNNQREDGVESLVSEEGRVAGVVLLSLIFVALLVVLILLRCCLKPLSLARIAWDTMDDDPEMPLQDSVGTGRRISGEYTARYPTQIPAVYSARSLGQNSGEYAARYPTQIPVEDTARYPTSDESSDSPRGLTKILTLGRKAKEKPKESVTYLADFVSDDYESTVTYEGGLSDSSNCEERRPA